MQADLEALASRVEQAEGADRELDALIFRAIGAPMPDKFGPLSIDLEWDETGTSALMAVGEMQVRFTPPAYTGSVDAALALVPKGAGHWPQMIYSGTNPNNPMAQRERVELWVKGRARPFRGHAATPALALTAASLRARALSRTAGEGEG